MKFGSNLRRSIHSQAVTSGPLACAQAAELNAQVPHLYLILTTNAVLQAATHVGSTPFLLSVAVPTALVLLSISRVASALRHDRVPTDPERAAQRLRITTALAFTIGLIFTVWSLSLLPCGAPTRSVTSPSTWPSRSPSASSACATYRARRPCSRPRWFCLTSRCSCRAASPC